MTPRVFLADDHAMVRIGLRQVLAELGGCQITGEAENGRQVLQADEALGQTDVLVLDLSLPVVGGAEVLKRVRRQHPHLAVVVHSMHPEGQFRRRAIEAGAVAYVSKEAPPQQLIDAVHRAAAAPEEVQGEVPEPAEASPYATLSRREHQVFHLIVAGRQVADIAAELDVHSCTVSNHLAKIRQKLGVSTVADMVRFAVAEGLVEVPGR